MNGWELDSQKKAQIWPLIQGIFCGLPLPFLMSLKIGFDFYILGPAYYLAMIQQKRWRVPAMLMALVGVILLETETLRWKYGLLLLLFTMEELYLDWKKPLLPFWKRCFVYEIGLVAAVVILSLLGRIAGYQLISIFLEAAFLMGAACLYHNTLKTKGVYDESMLAGLSLAVGTMLAAFHWVQVSGLIPAEIALLWIALISSYELGLARGMLLTLPAGFFMRLTLTAGEGLVILSMLLIVIAGIFRDMGKRATAAACFSGGSLWVLLFMGGINVVPGILTVGTALLLFGLTPAKAIEKAQKKRKPEKGLEKQWQRYFENALGQGAQAFQKMADLICVPRRQLRITSQDLVYLKEDLAGALCQECENQKICWGKQYARTHEAVVRVMEASRQKGRVERRDLSKEFLESCCRAGDFVRTVNRHYELYRLNQSWENKMAQSAQLLQGQYEAMAAYLGTMREHFAGELEAEEAVKQRIFRYVKRQGIPVGDIWALTSEKENRIQVYMETVRALNEHEIDCCQQVLRDMFGCPIVLQEKRRLTGNYYRYRFHDPNLYRLKMGVSTWEREASASGDSYTAQRLDEYRFVVALGDGMGSGKRAQEESHKALALLEQLLLTGVEEERAVELLNTTLVLSSKEEVFTTIDLALMNLHSGQLKLVKAGSCITFLRSRAAVHVYRSQSLPVGILEQPEPETFAHQMQDGDLIVMISDGVLDQLPEPKQGEKWIRRYLMKTEEQDPQRLAEDLRMQLAPYMPQVRDDQTVLAVRVEKLNL